MNTWKMMHIHLDIGKSVVSAVPPCYKEFGGRSFTSHVIADLVPPDCNPIGEENILVISTGLLAGSGASSSYRVSIGCKSPLTGGIKESNTGGRTGFALAMLGIRGVIISNIAPEWQIAIINKEGVELEPAGDLVGLNAFDTVEKLHARFGKKAAILTIGTAGEKLLTAACIGATDNDGIPARHAARGGPGAVMGSKRLKAIVIDAQDAKAPKPFDRDRTRAAVKTFATALLDHPTTNTALPLYGTAVMVDGINKVGGLPTRNYSQGQFESADRINGQALYDLIKERGGKTTHACMPGCVIRCSNVIPDKNGEELNRALEYETIALLGSNCGIDDLDTINRLNRMCDDLGIDTIETGAAIGVAMEAGLIPFGDGEKAIGLLEEIKNFSDVGQILGNGAYITGKVLGVKRIPVVKRQSMAAYDPRAIKGTGTTYATSPMGADHTAGNVLPGAKLPDGTVVEPSQAKDQIAISRYTQLMATIFDMLGLCWFTKPPIFEDISLVSDILSAQYEESWDEVKLMTLAKRTIATEIAFNKKAGFSEKDDDLPKFFRTEALPPKGYIYDVDQQALATLHQEKA